MSYNTLSYSETITVATVRAVFCASQYQDYYLLRHGGIWCFVDKEWILTSSPEVYIAVIAKLEHILTLPDERSFSCPIQIRKSHLPDLEPLYDENMCFRKDIKNWEIPDGYWQLFFGEDYTDFTKVPVSIGKGLQGKLQPVTETNKAWLNKLTRHSVGPVKDVLTTMTIDSWAEFKEWVTPEEIIQSYAEEKIGSCMYQRKCVGAYGVGKGQKVVTVHDKNSGKMKARAVIDRFGNFVRCYPHEFRQVFEKKGYVFTGDKPFRQKTLCLPDWNDLHLLYPDSLREYLGNYSMLRLVADPDGDKYFLLSTGRLPKGYTLIEEVAIKSCPGCGSQRWMQNLIPVVTSLRGDTVQWCSDCVRHDTIIYNDVLYRRHIGLLYEVTINGETITLLGDNVRSL